MFNAIDNFITLVIALFAGIVCTGFLGGFFWCLGVAWGVL